MKAGALQVAVEAAAQAAIGGKHQQRDVANGFAFFEQRVMHFQAAGQQVLDELASCAWCRPWRPRPGPSLS